MFRLFGRSFDEEKSRKDLQQAVKMLDVEAATRIIQREQFFAKVRVPTAKEPTHRGPAAYAGDFLYFLISNSFVVIDPDGGPTHSDSPAYIKGKTISDIAAIIQLIVNDKSVNLVEVTKDSGLFNPFYTLQHCSSPWEGLHRRAYVQENPLLLLAKALVPKDLERRKEFIQAAQYAPEFEKDGYKGYSLDAIAYGGSTLTGFYLDQGASIDPPQPERGSIHIVLAMLYKDNALLKRMLDSLSKPIIILNKEVMSSQSEEVDSPLSALTRNLIDWFKEKQPDEPKQELNSIIQKYALLEEYGAHFSRDAYGRSKAEEWLPAWKDQILAVPALNEALRKAGWDAEKA